MNLHRHASRQECENEQEKAGTPRPGHDASMGGREQPTIREDLCVFGSVGQGSGE